LALTDLADVIPIFNPAVAAYYIEACMICFESCGHVHTINLQIQGTFSQVFAISWVDAITEQMRRNWKDDRYTTEHGAVALALLVIRPLTGYTVIERSDQGTGFDYWLGNDDEGEDTEWPFQHKARLEISGIRRGTRSQVSQRVSDKRQQSRHKGGGLSTYVAVVEFSVPLSWVEHVP